MTAGLDFDAPVIPATYVQRGVELLDARGIAPARALERTGLTLESLARPALRLSLRVTAQVFANAMMLSGDPAIGLAFGLSLQPTSHGWVGMAVATAATMREALDVAVRFALLRVGALRLSWIEHDGRATLRFDEMISLGPLRPLLFDIVLGAFSRVVELSFPPGAIAEMTAVIVDPVQPHHAQFAGRIPRLSRGPRMELWFPAHWLDQAMPLHDAFAHREAVDRLESETLAVLSQDPVDRIRALLAMPDHRFPSLDVVARLLGMSSRSLRRHLRAAGTSFQALRDRARHAHATTLLASSMLPIGEIASALGYARVTGFLRAFRRWSGLSPAVYRSRMRRVGARAVP